MVISLDLLDAVVCPHPTSRANCTVYVKGDRVMGLCLSCKKTLERLMQEWEEGQRSKTHIGHVLAALGYSPSDAEQFIADLEAQA